MGIICLAPAFFFFAALIKIDSRGPVFFRQERIGRNGVPFKIHKFRTMLDGAEKRGLQITTQGDSRVTRVGHILRQFKLDELPQLIDVLIGNMSLVGPRPEVPKYVALYPMDMKQIILSVRPGITDRASIEYKDENILLGLSNDPNKTYTEEVLPKKLTIYADYVTNRSFAGDLEIIYQTIIKIIK